jgi:uncharacterized protein (TIGR02266 family)
MSLVTRRRDYTRGVGRARWARRHNLSDNGDMDAIAERPRQEKHGLRASLKSVRQPAELTAVAITRPIAEQNPGERRTAPRIELEVEVGMETDHNFYTGLTQDISSGGLFVATGISYNVGDRMVVRFTLPGRAEPIVADAEVRWLRDTRYMRTDSPEGVGLRFVSLTPEARKSIEAFLERRDSLFYDDE